MRKKLPIFAMLVAWCVAAGGQWELLQVFAWAKMFSGYAQTMSLGDSLRATFEPENRCRFCAMADEGRKQQDESDTAVAPDSAGKFLLVFQAAGDALIVVPAASDSVACERAMLSAGRAAPPTPPPRATVG